MSISYPVYKYRHNGYYTRTGVPVYHRSFDGEDTHPKTGRYDFEAFHKFGIPATRPVSSATTAGKWACNYSGAYVGYNAQGSRRNVLFAARTGTRVAMAMLRSMAPIHTVTKHM